MKLIENIKNYIGRYFLQKQAKKNSKSMHIPNFIGVQEIGIIYNAGSNENEEQVNKVVHFLREQGKKVWTMGFVNEKILPPSKKFHLNAEYFWKEKLSPFNLPQTDKIGTFITHKFDLLMNLYFEEDLPLQALSTYCNANFSIGAQIPYSLTYNDSVIDTNENHNIENLASQMIHYLKVIKLK
jgi:hypothetical protein